MMLSLDTNVLARYFLGDDLEQQRQASILISNHSCFVLMTVILELAWVLKSQKISKVIIIQKLIELSKLPNIHLENMQVFKNAMNWAISGLDVADAIHLSLSQYYAHLPMTTFDVNFIKKSQSIDGVLSCQPVKEFVG